MRRTLLAFGVALCGGCNLNLNADSANDDPRTASEEDHRVRTERSTKRGNVERPLRIAMCDAGRPPSALDSEAISIVVAQRRDCAAINDCTDVEHTWNELLETRGRCESELERQEYLAKEQADRQAEEQHRAEHDAQVHSLLEQPGAVATMLSAWLCVLEYGAKNNKAMADRERRIANASGATNYVALYQLGEELVAIEDDVTSTTRALTSKRLKRIPCTSIETVSACFRGQPCTEEEGRLREAYQLLTGAELRTR